MWPSVQQQGLLREGVNLRGLGGVQGVQARRGTGRIQMAGEEAGDRDMALKSLYSTLFKRYGNIP